MTKGIRPDPALVQLAEEQGVPLFTTPRMTSAVIEGLTAHLEEALAPRVTLHGVLMEIGGLGTLLLGTSGVGKSECALDLILRGHRFVADLQRIAQTAATLFALAGSGSSVALTGIDPGLVTGSRGVLVAPGPRFPIPVLLPDQAGY